MNNELKQIIHKKKILLEEYYIIPIFTLNNNSKFKLRKLQINGNIEILYPFDNFCNMENSELIEDILEKFRLHKDFREIINTDHNLKKVEKKKDNSLNLLKGSKWDGYKTITQPITIDFKDKKNNIKNNLIKLGYL